MNENHHKRNNLQGLAEDERSDKSEVCKTSYTGSIPVRASKRLPLQKAAFELYNCLENQGFTDGDARFIAAKLAGSLYDSGLSIHAESTPDRSQPDANPTQELAVKTSGGCPRCGKPLKRVRYPSGSMLNEDQFDSQRAGDWYCESCPGDRGNTGYRYFWSNEL